MIRDAIKKIWAATKNGLTGHGVAEAFERIAAATPTSRVPKKFTVDRTPASRHTPGGAA